MLRGSVLVLAFLICSPVLWQAFVSQTISIDAALVRFLLAVPVAGILLGLVRMAAGNRSRR
jgi:hypothetical protein